MICSCAHLHPHGAVACLKRLAQARDGHKVKRSRSSKRFCVIYSTFTCLDTCCAGINLKAFPISPQRYAFAFSLHPVTDLSWYEGPAVPDRRVGRGHTLLCQQRDPPKPWGARENRQIDCISMANGSAFYLSVRQFICFPDCVLHHIRIFVSLSIRIST